MWGLLYVGMWANPRMSVLFDTSDPVDAKVCALDHGKRVAAHILDRGNPIYPGTHYDKLNRPAGVDTMLGHVHEKAKGCPMRPKN